MKNQVAASFLFQEKSQIKAMVVSAREEAFSDRFSIIQQGWEMLWCMMATEAGFGRNLPFCRDIWAVAVLWSIEWLMVVVGSIDYREKARWSSLLRDMF